MSKTTTSSKISSSPWQKTQDSGTTGETACPIELHQQFASVVGQAFSLSGLLPQTARPMSPTEVERAARADPDAKPLNEGDLRRMKRTPRAKIIRRALALTQEEFASRYHMPLGTLRDWEQGRAEPDQPTQAYLTLIARDPDRVNRMLNTRSH